MELKQNTYTKLPSVPPIDEGHGYRLQKINKIPPKKKLEEEKTKREATRSDSIRRRTAFTVFFYSFNCFFS